MKQDNLQKNICQTSAEEIALYFVEKAKSETNNNEEAQITPLKLQKILYYAQGWYLGINGIPLFREDIYAWKYGPVVKEIYHKYKEYGSDNLAKIPSIETSNIKNDEIKSHLEKVWNTYGNESATSLVNRTHSSEPWLIAYREPFSDIISIKSMVKHFSSIAS